MSLDAFESFLRGHLARRRQIKKADKLFEAAEYSLFSGGKRFRPQVCFAAAKALDISFERVLPLAAAIEFIHTYSLIHDDLPCMDNDDLRRGRPTAHRAFGEAQALLAGDGLLTEAFALLGEAYAETPAIGLALVALVGEAAGVNGMVAGQVLDMELQEARATKPQPATVLDMLELKTGALIRLCVEGVAVVARCPPDERLRLREFGAQLGLAFQLADDLLDYDPKAAEPSGLPAALGAPETQKKLSEVSRAALTALEPYQARASELRALVEINLSRKT